MEVVRSVLQIAVHKMSLPVIKLTRTGTSTASQYKPSENQAMTVCMLNRQTLLNITKGQSCWYCKSVNFKTLAICTRTLAGNLSLWSVTANVSS